MSYNTSMDTVTVNGVPYDVEREATCHGYALTIEEFPGLESLIANEEYIEEHDNPRQWSNVGTMAVSYDRYNLGDEPIKDIDFEVECPECKGDGWREFGDEGEKPCGNCEGSGYVALNPTEYFKQKHGARVVLPLSVYEHSGITMFVGHKDYIMDPGGWDTSYVGFIYDTPEKVNECIGDNATDEQIEQAMRDEVKVYASYLEGDVTYWRVEDTETGYDEACGGYVGDTEGCEAECFSNIEAAIVKRLAENEEKAHWAARDTITL